MRVTAPHALVRFRITLLVCALVALALAAIFLFARASLPFPVARPVALLALVFVWANGFFWWLELRYPHIPSAGGFASRVELGSRYQQAFSSIFFAGYTAAAVLATVACTRLALEG